MAKRPDDKVPGSPSPKPLDPAPEAGPPEEFPKSKDPFEHDPPEDEEDQEEESPADPDLPEDGAPPSEDESQSKIESSDPPPIKFPSEGVVFGESVPEVEINELEFPDGDTEIGDVQATPPVEEAGPSEAPPVEDLGQLPPAPPPLDLESPEPPDESPPLSSSEQTRPPEPPQRRVGRTELGRLAKEAEEQRRSSPRPGLGGLDQQFGEGPPETAEFPESPQPSSGGGDAGGFGGGVDEMKELLKELILKVEITNATLIAIRSEGVYMRAP